MASVKVRQSIKDDAAFVAAFMRDSDRLEIWRANRSKPYNALIRGYEQSVKCYTAEVDGKPAIMFGVVSQGLLSSKGIIWMLATDDLYKIRKSFLEQSRDYVDELQKGFSETYNFVDVDNKASIRWLKWLGFTFEDAEPHGVQGELFMRFYKCVQ